MKSAILCCAHAARGRLPCEQRRGGKRKMGRKKRKGSRSGRRTSASGQTPERKGQQRAGRRGPSLVWQCPPRDGGDPGGGNIVANLFGGKNSVRVDVFVREDLQNRVDACSKQNEGPVNVRIRRNQIPFAVI